MPSTEAVAVDTSELIFDEGIIGVPRARRFRLLEEEGSPIRLLSSLDIKGFVLPVVDPWLADADYRPRLERHVRSLGCASGGDVLVLAVALVEGGRAFANLRAPLLLDIDRRAGAQVILDDMTLPLRAPVKMND